MMLGFLILTFTINTQAQEAMTRGRPIQDRMAMMGMAANGFRIGISKGLVNGRNEDISSDTSSASFNGDVLNDFGASLGYAYLPSEDLGFLGHVGYQSYDGGNIGAMRVDANLAYTFQERFSAYAGGNANKFMIGSKNIRDFSTGFGWQAGLGFQFNQTFGFDVQYVETRNSRSLTRNGTQGNTDLRISGLEFIGHMTF